MSSSDRFTRLSGVVRRLGADVTGPLLHRIVVSSSDDEKELGRTERFSAFALEVVDGSHVRVELAANLLLEPITTKTKKWEDAREDKDLPSISVTPTLYEEVDIESASLDEGMKVELLAFDLDFAFEEAAAGHRAAPARKLTRVTARAIASGDDASESIDRLEEMLGGNDGGASPAARTSAERKIRKRKGFGAPPRFVGGYVAAGFAIVFLLAAYSIPLSPLRVDFTVLAFVAIAWGASWFALARRPRFVRGQNAINDVSKDKHRVLIALVIAVLGVAWFGALIDDITTPARLPNATTPAVNASMASCVALVLFALAIIIIFQRASLREDVRIMKRLLDAPPLPPIGEELATKWGSFEGVVRDPSPVASHGEASAIVHIVDETERPGSDPNMFVERVLSEGTFFVHDRSRSRTKFEIHPKDALWTSAVRLKMKVDHDKQREVQLVPIGGSLLVAGRAVREKKARTGRLASTGVESLIFFAAAPGERVREAIASLIRIRILALVVVALCGAAGVFLAVHEEARLPPFNMGDHGD